MKKEIRNGNGKLVASIDEATRTVEIVQRGNITKIRLKPDGSFEVINTEPQTA